MALIVLAAGCEARRDAASSGEVVPPTSAAAPASSEAKTDSASSNDAAASVATREPVAAKQGPAAAKPDPFAPSPAGPNAASPSASSAADVPLDAPLDVKTLVQLYASLPALSRDGKHMAIDADADLGMSDVESLTVWVFEVADADLDIGAGPTETLPLVTPDDARQAIEQPTTGVRDRIVAQVRRANERLVALGFDAPQELDEDYDLVEKGDTLLKKWKYPPFTITESAGDRMRLTVKKGKTVVKTIGSPYGPEDEGQCTDWPDHQVFCLPEGQQGLLVLTHLDGPPMLGCSPKPRLRLVSVVD